MTRRRVAGTVFREAVMFTIIVQSCFSATHRLRLEDGTVEPLHGHDWLVRAYFSRSGLNDFGMVIDFDFARTRLDEVIAPLRYANLSEHPALGGRNATAEVVARFVYDGLVSRGIDCVRRVEITEAPGCVAIYDPSDRSDG